MGVRARCFSSEWVDLGIMRVLLYRLKYEVGLPSYLSLESGMLSALVRGSGELSELFKVLRKYPEIVKLRRECDLSSIELVSDGAHVSLVVSSKRIKCVPLAPAPDVVKSLEVLSRNQGAASVEIDPLQRSTLSKSVKQLEPGFYVSCLVGEALGSDTVAIGVELLNHGLRTAMASELRQTSVVEAVLSRPRSRKKRKVGRKRRKKRKSKK